MTRFNAIWKYHAWSAVLGILALVGAFVLRGYVGAGAWYSVLAYACCLTLGVLAAIELLRRRAVHAGVWAAALVLSIGLLASNVRVSDGTQDVPVQLTIKHAEPVAAERERTIQVQWCVLTDGREVQTAWSPLPADAAASVYGSQARLRVARHAGYFTSDVSWYVEPGAIILIVVDQQRELRFEPRTLFGSDASGAPPRTLSATIDVDEYLHGTKRAPEIEWPIASVRDL